ncbi:MAG TPA: hypothetical protein VM367_06765 [Pseudonocardia sp.]|nr:hypothetical protein [Pseudonocardia sp.]
MGDRKLNELREHFDSTDFAEVIDSATWESEVDVDPMIVTSVRLPKSLLGWIREQAAAEQLKPTALIRRWIEDRRRASSGEGVTADERVAQLADRVSRLEAFAIRIVAAEPGTGDTGGISDLLMALRASVEAARTDAPQNPGQERRGA